MLVTPLQLQVFGSQRFYCSIFAGAAVVIVEWVRRTRSLQAGTRKWLTGLDLWLHGDESFLRDSCHTLTDDERLTQVRIFDTYIRLWEEHKINRDCWGIKTLFVRNARTPNYLELDLCFKNKIHARLKPRLYFVCVATTALAMPSRSSPSKPSGIAWRAPPKNCGHNQDCMGCDWSGTLVHHFWRKATPPLVSRRSIQPLSWAH